MQVKLRTVQTRIFDAKRRREIPLQIFAPRTGGPYPAIFFSHGSRVPVAAYFFLMRFWAERGYVCFLPTHEGRSESVAQPRHWLMRARDVSSCIDLLPGLERRLPHLRGRIDHLRIGAAGHSHGAHTALLLAGARMHRPEGGALDLSDPRISAFIAISPPGAGCLGMRRSSYSSLASPLLSLSGDLDRDLTFGKPASWRLEPFRHAPATSVRDRFHALVSGADHYSFFEAVTIHASSFALPDPRVLALTQRLSASFWDLHLKGRGRLRDISGVRVIAK